MQTLKDALDGGVIIMEDEHKTPLKLGDRVTLKYEGKEVEGIMGYDEASAAFEVEVLNENNDTVAYASFLHCQISELKKRRNR